MSLKAKIKRKLPATFNAAEYETERLLNRIQDLENKLASTEQKNMAIMKQLIDSVRISQKKIEESNLLSIIKCKSDADFDRSLIPFNRFFQGHGMAIVMHLTSVDKKLDESVYHTADLTRTSTLALIADEIYDRKLGGAVAELGVAQGKFAKVINALFSDKKLYLFDTFEGFPETDADFERLNQYSNPLKHSYANIDLEQLMGRMRYPDHCVIKKGYFPDTVVGLEESFCFVSIDCDLYKPVYAGLNYFYPRLVTGGYIFVHDYRSKVYRGVKEALRKFASEQGISYCVLPDNTGTAIIAK